MREIELRREALERLGYEYISDFETTLPERRYFRKPATTPRRFHLHAVVFEGTFWSAHIAFRDALRARPGLARDYAVLKTRLASEFADDLDGYTDAKSAFIAAALRKR